MVKKGPVDEVKPPKAEDAEAPPKKSIAPPKKP